MKEVAEVYFTHPYTSCERVTYENHNGMIRRFILKSNRISTVCDTTIRNINIWMNDYPRKILDYLTPHALFEEALQAQN